VLEPSAGTGLLAIFAELAGAKLVLNELADGRADLLTHLFPSIPVARHDAAHIHDHLDVSLRPTVVLMNPPFSAAAHVEGRVTDAALRHVSSALARLANGGRLIAIMGAGLSPDNPSWRYAFVTLQERGRIVFTAAIDGRVYARHGTNTDTRLTVFDRVPAEDPAAFPPPPGMASNTATLLDWVTKLVPPRAAVAPVGVAGRVFAPAMVRTPLPRPAPRGLRHVTSIAAVEPAGVELAYHLIDWAPAEVGRITDALYESYTLQSIRIPGSKPHPTRLVQSAAMASVAPPKPDVSTGEALMERRPLTLNDALEVARDPRSRLLINGQSGRAAVQVPAPSAMLDDGEVERRVRLVRPMERMAISVAKMAQTHWQEADHAAFTATWEAELAIVPQFTDSELHIVTGLLLPIWKQLPDESVRVYRLQTDAGERVIGRLVSPAWVAQAVDSTAPTLTPAGAFAAVLDSNTVLQLQEGLALRRVKVSDFRIELSGFTDGMVDRLKTFGLMSEIIFWKLRLFVPTSPSGPEILRQLLERYPLVRIGPRPVSQHGAGSSGGRAAA
jgi:predicted RNA methylase